MAIINNQIVKMFLREYMDTLSGENLVSLRNSLTISSRVEDLPDELAESLHLRDYCLVRNLVEIILTEFDKLVPGRCLLGNLLTDKQKDLLLRQIEEKKTEKFKPSSEANMIEKASQDDNIQPDIPPVLQQYFDHLIQAHLGERLSKAEITTKIIPEEGQLVTLIVKHEVLVLSQCLPEVEKWLSILGDRLKEVHFVAKEIFHLDYSLEKNKWHGTNILVICGKLQYAQGKTLYWDLSGKSGEGSSENGGNLTVVSKEYTKLTNFKVVTNGGSFEGEGCTMSLKKIMLSLFPPSATSDGLRKLVFENAVKFGGTTPTQFLYEPKDAFDTETKKVMGPISEMYMEAETEGNLKLYVGFRKGKLLSRNSFCLIQDKGIGKKRSTGKPGNVTFVTMANPGTKIPDEELGIKIVGVKGNGGNLDVGYMEINTKQLVEYSGKQYGLKMEDSEKPGSINCKLLGKHVRILEKTGVSDAEMDGWEMVPSGNPRDSSKSTCSSQGDMGADKLTDAITAVQMYGEIFNSETEGNRMDKLLSTYEAEWWTKKILSTGN